MLSKDHRLYDQKQFLVVLKKGKRHYNSGVLLYWTDNAYAKSRFGFIVGKKYSTSAVKRNRQKRILRSVVRDVLPQIVPGKDIVFSYANRDKVLPYIEAKKVILDLLKNNHLLLKK
jgi:ribonuclease P protein component